DPERARKEAMEALRESFRPEFLNRIDEIVIFNPLGKEQLAKIVGLLMKDVERLLAERQLTLEVKPAAQELLLREGYDPAYGARPLRRTIQRDRKSTRLNSSHQISSYAVFCLKK